MIAMGTSTKETYLVFKLATRVAKETGGEFEVPEQDPAFMLIAQLLKWRVDDVDEVYTLPQVIY